MLHLYEINEDSEIYAADSEEQVITYYRYLCNEEPDYVKQLPDDEIVEDCPHCGRGGETNAELAAGFNSPMQVFTGYN